MLPGPPLRRRLLHGGLLLLREGSPTGSEKRTLQPGDTMVSEPTARTKPGFGGSATIRRP